MYFHNVIEIKVAIDADLIIFSSYDFLFHFLFYNEILQR